MDEHVACGGLALGPNQELNKATLSYCFFFIFRPVLQDLHHSVIYQELHVHSLQWDTTITKQHSQKVKLDKIES